jgi:hypothetical protein
LNSRPIELEGYSLVAGAVEPPYLITLIPTDAEDIRKSWKFRCDTLHEFNEWIEKFSNALKNNDNIGYSHGNKNNDLLVLDTEKSILHS